MSRPDPLTVNVPLASANDPARIGLPMSRLAHVGVGSAGAVTPCCIEMLSNVAVAGVESRLVTARPT